MFIYLYVYLYLRYYPYVNATEKLSYVSKGSKIHYLRIYLTKISIEILNSSNLGKKENKESFFEWGIHHVKGLVIGFESI